MPQTAIAARQVGSAYRSSPPSRRLAWIDGLRLTAGLSMLGLHASADLHGLPFANATPQDRFWPMMLRALFYCARTELFVMLSVFLLMLSLSSRPRSYLQTIAEQARRLLIPFLFWTLFYSGYSLLKAWHLGYFSHAVDHLRAPSVWAAHLLLGTAKYHMHFIPTLFGLLIFFPLFRLAVARPWLISAAIVGLMFKWTMERWAYPMFWDTAALPYIIRLIKVIAYLGYGLTAAALAGIWLRHQRSLRGAVPWRAVTILALSGIVLLTLKIRTMQTVIAEGRWVFDDLAGYWADFLMPIVLLGLCMMLASRTWPNLLSVWAPYSLGIYLCHPIFLDLAEMLLPVTARPATQVTVKLLVALPMTLALTRFLQSQQSLGWTIGLGPLPRLTLAKRLLRHN